MNARRPLAPHFAQSSAINAGRSLVHRWLADAARERPPGDDVFAADASIVAPADGYGATFASWESLGPGVLALEFIVPHGRIVARHRDDAGGGRLTGATFVRDDGVQAAVPDEDAWTRNRCLAFAHRWLWAWEHVGDGAEFRDLLDFESLDARFGRGVEARSVDEFFNIARSLDANMPDTHHALRDLVVETRQGHYDVTAEIDWRGASAGGTPLRARTRQRWVLLERDDRYPRLGVLAIDAVHPFEPDLLEPREDPELANAPSDDAESGGA